MLLYVNNKIALDIKSTIQFISLRMWKYVITYSK